MSDTPPAAQPPALLTMASFQGTLAAARCLGRAGIPVVMAESNTFAPARWSRYVTRRVDCPSPDDAERFVEWLLEFGRREPGHVLYPTSDDLAWLFALHGDELSKSFRMFQPKVETIYALLNKKQLALAAKEAGVDTPATWFPADAAGLEAMLPEIAYPVLVKPKTQILFAEHHKGSRVDGPEDLRKEFASFASRTRYGRTLLERDPDVAVPMLQAYVPSAAQGIYSLSGFVDASGDAFVTRSSMKVLQRPRKVGIGVCFEDAPRLPHLEERLRALCRHLGYHGAFEVEFIADGGRHLLIDFNPRYYGQMAFEIARGLPLPLLVHAAAQGDRPGVRRISDEARSWAPDGKHIFCHRFSLEVMLRAQRLSGKLSADEARTWRSWYATNRSRATDPIVDSEDWRPALADILTQLYGYARHPKGFVRGMVLDR